MFWVITTHLIALTAGFGVGIFVYHNNKAKADKYAQDLEDKYKELEAKAKEKGII